MKREPVLRGHSHVDLHEGWASRVCPRSGVLTSVLRATLQMVQVPSPPRAVFTVGVSPHTGAERPGDVAEPEPRVAFLQNFSPSTRRSNDVSFALRPQSVCTWWLNQGLKCEDHRRRCCGAAAVGPDPTEEPVSPLWIRERNPCPVALPGDPCTRGNPFFFLKTSSERRNERLTGTEQKRSLLRKDHGFIPGEKLSVSLGNRPRPTAVLALKGPLL